MASSTNNVERLFKGKSKATTPNELTPLLPDSSTPPSLRHTESPLQPDADDVHPDDADHDADPEFDSHPRRSLRSTLTLVFLSSLVLSIIIVLFAFLLVYSYASRLTHASPQDVLRDALVFHGPDQVEVLNITEDGGLWLNVEARVGVDAGKVLGVNREEEDEGTLTDVWKGIGRWGIQWLDRVTIDLSEIQVFDANADQFHDRILTSNHTEVVLATVQIPAFTLPLSADPPPFETWLTPISLPLLVYPTQNTSDITHFLRESWAHGTASISAHVGHVVVGGGGDDSSGWDRWWKEKLRVSRDNLEMGLSVPVPHIPGLPVPGHKTPFPSFGQLIKLEEFTISSDISADIKDGATARPHLHLEARASVLNPLPPGIKLNVPALPFIISLPHPKLDPNDDAIEPHAIPIASATTRPFTLNHSNATIWLTGDVLHLEIPLSLFASSSPDTPTTSFSAIKSHTNPTVITQALSLFISNYLALAPHNPILISLASPLLSNDNVPLTVEMDFPPPQTKPRILRDVTIKDMRIRPAVKTTTAAFLASGVVYARVVLPPGMDLDMDVTRVFPDVLVFDGDVPELHNGTSSTPYIADPSLPESKDTDDDLPQPLPLPDPLPPRAFGHIRPEEWIPATSMREGLDSSEHSFWNNHEGGEEEKGGSSFIVTANLVDIPLEVLPGRQKEFRDFVGKVIFGTQGALAGLDGQAAVGVHVHGLGFGENRGNGEIQFTRLPFQGNVRVGKKGMSIDI
ncbi:hypothetical protein BJ138DRAFT_996845 [Hygrophoropsis aurantiaca]|uniref:Uncharacterized protein n=1 Tax=Hygrophoropsis aurantiaca TaxID=72124 RepID=A0ACB8ASN9_9AGAM|nr:hypothetical protein BJ138DRAFT_996845 [Hygrophoropsis aurantiaca]